MNPDHHINVCDNANKVASNVTLVGDDDKCFVDHNTALDSPAREAEPPGSCDNVTEAAKTKNSKPTHGLNCLAYIYS